ncbi:MAG: pyruvate, water dikinase [Parcubacteria group bacterium Gr01-1014_29]|nr:MAG: pyruvate, water dikinase [Parcubacteria group bacterium Gr01-1014_29]
MDNKTTWEFVISRKMGLFETWCSGEGYKNLPFGCRMNNVIVSRDGVIKRYNSSADMKNLEQKIQSNDVIPVLTKLAEYDDQLNEVLKMDPVTSRWKFLDAVFKTWIYEIFGYYVGIYSKDPAAIALVEKLRGVHNAQHVAASEFVPKLLEQISDQTGIETELLKYATPQEVRDLKFDAEELKKRQKFYVLALIDNETSFYAQDTAEQKIAELGIQEEQTDVGKVEQMSGTVAYKGFVSGKVAIVNDEQDLEKINEGDILVSIMTRTTLVSGMKKSAAIVTDEGGVTCHAAIIARELKKPCIIGTKIATLVLKDGDMVEVDANNGIVKIIK